MFLLVHTLQFHKRLQHLDDEALIGYPLHAKNLISGRQALNLFTIKETLLIMSASQFIHITSVHMHMFNTQQSTKGKEGSNDSFGLEHHHFVCLWWLTSKVTILYPLNGYICAPPFSMVHSSICARTQFSQLLKIFILYNLLSWHHKKSRIVVKKCIRNVN